MALLVGMTASSGTDSGGASAGPLSLHGRPQPLERMIVIARTSQDTGWLHLRFGDIPVAVYQAVKNLTEHRERCPPGVNCEQLAAHA